VMVQASCVVLVVIPDPIFITASLRFACGRLRTDG
jgi:hypothetical protein